MCWNIQQEDRNTEYGNRYRDWQIVMQGESAQSMHVANWHSCLQSQVFVQRVCGKG